MWSAIVDLGIWILGLFGFGKPDPVKQGENLGKAETTEKDALGELSDVKTASDARNSVSDDANSLLDDPNNAGPDKPIQPYKGRSLY